MDTHQKIDRVGSLKRRETEPLKGALKNVFVVDNEPYFTEMLQALDRAEIDD